jgi:hypothetical protein
MKVNYLTKADARLASHRFRVNIPSALFSDNTTPVVSNNPDLSADVYVIQKHFHEFLQDAQLLKEMGKVVVQDICDDHFDKEAGEYYRQIAEIAHHITVPTEAMRQRVKEVTGRDSTVIKDSYSFKYKAPSVRSTAKPKIGWFGHISNLFSIVPYYTDLKGLEFYIVTNNIGGIRNRPDNVTLFEYNKDTVENIIERVDIVILPRINDPSALTKSPNRTVDSIRAGKFVIAPDSIHKEEFNPYIYTDTNIDEALDLYSKPSSKSAIENIIKEGQAYVEDHYSPLVISRAWESFLQGVKN